MGNRNSFPFSPILSLTTGKILTAICANAVVTYYLPAGLLLMGINSGIYGVLGAGLGCLILNWPNIYLYRFPRVVVFWMFCLLIGITMMLTRSQIGIICELTAFLVGILVGMFCSPCESISERENKHFSFFQIFIWVLGFLSYFLLLTVYIVLIILV